MMPLVFLGPLISRTFFLNFHAFGIQKHQSVILTFLSEGVSKTASLVSYESHFRCLSSQVGFLATGPLLKETSSLLVALKWLGVSCVLALMEAGHVLLYVVQLFPQLEREPPYFPDYT